MLVINLILEHFKGIASGRGKSRVELDFSKSDPQSKLIALSGPNGSSKTTIMDNMHPYRVMPSRASSPTPTSFSFYPHVVEGKDAVKDLRWSHKGQEFRSVIRIRTTGKTNKQECYLTQKVGETFVPYSNDSGLTSDGKTDTYDRSVEAILGKPEVFFATQFSAQGKKPISTMSAGDVKALLASMLTMGSFKTLSDKASEVVKGLKPHLSAQQSMLLPLETLALTYESAIRSKSDLKARLREAVELAAARKNQVRACQLALAELQSKVTQQEAVVAQRASLVVQLESVAQQNETQLEEFESRQKADRQGILTANESAINAVRVARSAVTSATQKVTDTHMVINGESAIQKAQAFHQTSLQTLNGLRSQETDLYVDSNKFAQLTEMVGKMRELFATEKANGIALVQSIDAAQTIAALIGEVPCKGHAFSGRCKLLADANVAGQSLPQKESQVVELRTKLQTDQLKIRHNGAELQRLTQANADLQALRGKISELELQMSEAKTVMKTAAALDKAKQEIAGFKETLCVATADLRSAEENYVKTKAAVENIVSKQASEKEGFLSVLYKERTRILRAMDALPSLVAVEDISASKEALEHAEQQLVQLEERKQTLASEQSREESNLAGIEAAKLKISQITQLCDSISNEISRWTLLSKALGNDGIIAMSIDDAGPEISALCNSLLKDCAGGDRFNVSLSTQAATASGALKEAFLINVEDIVRDEQKELGLMSGGEKVWINECLVRAMALYMSQSTGSDFKTLFSDEADGPLDPERKRQYMALKRSVLERGGYDREFIITQTPELLLLCDEVIDVTAL